MQDIFLLMSNKLKHVILLIITSINPPLKGFFKEIDEKSQ